MKTIFPPTQGRGKWGRRIKNNRRNRDRTRPHVATGHIVVEDRTGSGVHVRVTAGVLVEHSRTPGVIRQSFYSSPRLRDWFESHDALIDARIERSEREEYRRLCRESAAYRARKAAQKKVGR